MLLFTQCGRGPVLMYPFRNFNLSDFWYAHRGRGVDCLKISTGGRKTVWKVLKHYHAHRGTRWTVCKKRSSRLKIFLTFWGYFKDFHGFELGPRSSKNRVLEPLETISKSFLELDMVGF